MKKENIFMRILRFLFGKKEVTPEEDRKNKLKLCYNARVQGICDGKCDYCAWKI